MLRRLLLPGLLLAVLLGTGWLAWLQPDDYAAPGQPYDQAAADYILSGLKLRQYDEQGKLARELKAGRLTHTADQGTLLDQPRLTIHSSSGAPWVISGARGQVDADGQTLSLPEDAVISRMATLDNQAMRLVTRDLLYRLDQGYAATDEAVTVTRDRDRIDAVGMEAWLHEPSRIHFRSQVRGHYEP